MSGPLDVLRNTIGSLASAVRSGEPYTDQLNDQRNAGIEALAAVEQLVEAARDVPDLDMRETDRLYEALARFQAGSPADTKEDNDGT